MRILTILFGSFLGVFLSLALAQAGIETERQVEETLHSLVSTLNAGDWSKLTKSYANNAVMMSPSSEILNDPTAIQSYWQELALQGVGEFSIESVDVKVQNNTAYQSTIWSAVRHVENGKDIPFQGNMSNVLVLQSDGSWAIQLQSWN